MSYYRLLISVLLILSITTAYGQSADFTADVVSGCSPLVVQFSDQSTGSPTSWNWDFGNGNSSTLQNPNVVYASPGLYNVTLTVDGSSSTTKSNFITVYVDPSVDFNSDITVGCVPLTVQFNDMSMPGDGSIVSWEWVFGDGGIRTEQNPQYTYETAGDFSVTLTVTNEFNCEQVLSKANLISALAYEAAFKVNDDASCQVPATIDFNNLSVGPGSVSYVWDFGDGSTSLEENPSHTFSSAGVYQVRLAVTSDICKTTIVEKQEITIGQTPPELIVSATDICAGDRVNFFTRGGSDVLSVNWNFGDGSSSDLISTSNVYSLVGSYNVTLEVEYTDGCIGQAVERINVVDAPNPTFSFTQDCDKTITFMSNSFSSDSFLWDFGDGSGSIEENPVHTYESFGDYTVRLIATNSSCSRATTRNLLVLQVLRAEFSPTILSSCEDDETLGGCLPKTINFKDTSPARNNIVSWLWDFGDGSTSADQNPTYTYTSAGDFTASLTVTDEQGCTDTKTRGISVVSPDNRPVAGFTVDKSEACISQNILLTDTSTGEVDFWCWDLGDGRVLQTTEPSLNFAYGTIGTYTISLSVSVKGCTSSDSFVITDAITVLPPDPDYVIDKNCDDPYTIELLNLSTGADSFLWDFGDGNFSDLKDPGTHTYASTGNYLVSLTTTNEDSGCEIERFRSVRIIEIEANFDVSNNRLCINDAVNFFDLSTDAVQWEWDFGNGEFSTVQNPRNIRYPSSGKYTVELKAYDADGCSSSTAKNDIVVVADLAGNFGRDIVMNYCDSLSVEFNDLSVAFPEINSWSWDFGDGTFSNEQNPTHTYQQIGDYTVSLTIQNGDGECAVIKEDAVAFKEPLPKFSTSKSQFCLLEPVLLKNSSLNAINYIWYIDGDTLTDVNPIVTFPELGSYTIKLKAIDSDGCSNEISKEQFVSIQQPKADFTAEQVSSECPPLLTTFINKSSADVTSWDWRMDDNTFSVLESPTQLFTEPGDYDISLIVTDDIGCIDSVRSQAFVKIGGPSGAFSISDSVGCLNREVNFTAISDNAVKYIWDFGTGVVVESSSPELAHTYDVPGEYIPSLILEDEFGCQVAVTQTNLITIFDTTEVDFSVPLDFPFTGEEISILHDTLTLGSWSWDMGDGSVLFDQLPVHIYQEGGMLNISLTYTNENGCESVIDRSLFIQEDLRFIPNVFTPNGDKTNNTFDMLDLEKGFWNVKIYNRYGKLIYEMDDYDGTWLANEVSPGVYYYHVVNQYRADKYYKGYVQVLK